MRQRGFREHNHRTHDLKLQHRWFPDVINQALRAISPSWLCTGLLNEFQSGNFEVEAQSGFKHFDCMDGITGSVTLSTAPTSKASQAPSLTTALVIEQFGLVQTYQSRIQLVNHEYNAFFRFKFR